MTYPKEAPSINPALAHTPKRPYGGEKKQTGKKNHNDMVL